MVSFFGPGIDGMIMRELLPKVTQLCSGRYLNREGNLSKGIALLDRRVDLEDDDMYYGENYKICERALAALQEHDAIANPYLNAAARIVTRFVSSVFFRNRKEKIRSIEIYRALWITSSLGKMESTLALMSSSFSHSQISISVSRLTLSSLKTKRNGAIQYGYKERRTVNDDDLLEHICSMQDVHVHLNTCRWSERAWSLQTWGRDEKPFRMSLNQAIRENKNTNDIAMRVERSYEEWEIDVAQDKLLKN